MTRSMRKRIGTVRMCIGATLGVWLTASGAHAGTVTIAVIPSVIDAVDTVAQAFEAAHVGDRVRIVVISETELMGSIKSLPVQLVASDDSSLIEWMEARDFARRPEMGPAISVPLAVVSSSSDAAVFSSTGDLLNRMKQQGIVIAIPDPKKIDCGRRAQALLKTVGLSAEPSERLVFAKHAGEVLALVQNGKAQFGLVFVPDAMTTKGITIHAWSAPGAFSPVNAFALKRGQQDHPVAQRFLAFVSTSQGQQALKARGYELVQDSQLNEAAATKSSIASPSISR
ncbi:MAG TPA: substrate-binding domain-containing protein [Nitrospiraceae bacterium]|nr:substrate-binding domain-containing protein [Nitrospiraceae bacterium]